MVGILRLTRERRMERREEWSRRNGFRRRRRQEVAMRRWLAVATGALVLAAFFHSSVGVQAATKTATGTVSAVSADSLTVKGKEAGKDVEWTFHVDTKTTVIGKGAGTKAKDIKDEKKSPQIV